MPVGPSAVNIAGCQDHPEGHTTPPEAAVLEDLAPPPLSRKRRPVEEIDIADTYGVGVVEDKHRTADEEASVQEKPDALRQGAVGCMM